MLLGFLKTESSPPAGIPFFIKPGVILFLFLFLIFLGKFFTNFNLKNMISTYPKDFQWKKWPKFVRFQINRVSKSSDFYDKF
jgi:hypothetical protein